VFGGGWGGGEMEGMRCDTQHILPAKINVVISIQSNVSTGYDVQYLSFEVSCIMAHTIQRSPFCVGTQTVSVLSLHGCEGFVIHCRVGVRVRALSSIAGSH